MNRFVPEKFCGCLKCLLRMFSKKLADALWIGLRELLDPIYLINFFPDKINAIYFININYI